LSIPTIGIGAGTGCDAQVLVWQDLLGLTPDPAPKFVKRYADLRAVMADAVTAWSHDVVNGAYPDEEHSYS
jgi:3-methyl-2-oxobutanoate hydroxymethyltransferase